ncbi:Putative serine/threonine-protein kinase/receptor R826 [Psilocybe cubensis]|uniref:Protein kinase domain-containing protein n=2 Tax=Psilocybe cubensis TaxID=181762 RepID=A0A8H8CGQ2_PSICU|nr:Putative serine/threonine-protein kinase/receptor R826 [Psilocybe cubensis]KAH9475156.1 Putative serine/threonine-protein kinase/receptor R826 [Psilocybe cubensis]
MLDSVPKYFPNFLLKFWLSTGSILPTRPPRVHVYDVYDNELTEIHQSPKKSTSVFHELNIGLLEAETRKALSEAEGAFAKLELETEVVLKDLLDRTVWSGGSCSTKRSLPFDRKSVEILRKYFVFLRFRNSAGYRDTALSLTNSYQADPEEGVVYSAYRPLIVQFRLRHILRGFIKFLNHTSADGPFTKHAPEFPTSGISVDAFQEAMDLYCWSLCEAELCIGLATEDQEFMLSDRCFGTLDEGFDEDPECCDLFFPIFPTLALYILGTAGEHYPSTSTYLQTSRSTVWIDIGCESASDVHLRNAMILQTYPEFLYFQSLRTVSLSISSYDEFRWIQEHQDYSRLKQRCRQKFLQETVTKTLIVRGSLILTDLTDEVVLIGDSAVAHGSFSDVWKGVWDDPIERRPRTVALKFLRQIMVQNVREKLLKRLQAEVVAWHRLCHKNVSQLFGIFQSPNSIAMVSQWCDNGTICSYLKNTPNANRLRLLIQVASGISYLHAVKPTIVHGDLKGGNILIDENGNAIISDFGLSKVLEEEMTDANSGTSFFAGSTRWMAPELIFALVEDNGVIPPISTYSDVYAFASICLEIASGQLPYPNRSNDHSVTVDVIRGIKPSRTSVCLLGLTCDGEEAFWSMLEQCWSVEPASRPTMPHMLSFLEVLEASRR